MALTKKAAVNANPEEVVTVKAEPSHVYFLRDTDGKLQRCEAAPEPRNSEVFDLKSFVDAVKHYKGRAVSVWCGQNKIEAVLEDEDDGSRRARLVMKLTTARPFETLCHAKHRGDGMPQRAFVDFLRVQLAGCLEAGIVDTFRAITFADDASGEATIQIGRETLRRKRRIELLAGGQEVPDEITVRVPLYEEIIGTDVAEPQAVRCVVHIDLSKQCFSLIPLTNDLSKAGRVVDQSLVAWLVRELDGAATVFAGAPTPKA